MRKGEKQRGRDGMKKKVEKGDKDRVKMRGSD